MKAHPSVPSVGRGGRGLQAVLDAIGRLTPRDRYLAAMVHEHRVLTTDQVTDIAFSATRRARRRLTALHAMGVLTHFRPRHGPGSAPWHWMLGPTGAAVLAADDADLVWNPDAARATAASQRLGHLVGTNGFFTALVRTARTTSGCDLGEWWPERRCTRHWGDIVRPDGYGVWTQDGLRLPFFLEYDNGTERLARLGAKLDGYAQLADAVGYPTWVLYRFGSSAREAHARRVLGHRVVPVATATLDVGDSPAGVPWRPVKGSESPRPLVELAHGIDW